MKGFLITLLLIALVSTNALAPKKSLMETEQATAAKILAADAQREATELAEEQKADAILAADIAKANAEEARERALLEAQIQASDAKDVAEAAKVQVNLGKVTAAHMKVAKQAAKDVKKEAKETAKILKTAAIKDKILAVKRVVKAAKAKHAAAQKKEVVAKARLSSALKKGLKKTAVLAKKAVKQAVKQAKKAAKVAAVKAVTAKRVALQVSKANQRAADIKAVLKADAHAQAAENLASALILEHDVKEKALIHKSSLLQLKAFAKSKAKDGPSDGTANAGAVYNTGFPPFFYPGASFMPAFQTAINPLFRSPYPEPVAPQGFGMPFPNGGFRTAGPAGAVPGAGGMIPMGAGGAAPVPGGLAPMGAPWYNLNMRAPPLTAPVVPQGENLIADFPEFLEVESTLGCVNCQIVDKL